MSPFALNKAKKKNINLKYYYKKELKNFKVEFLQNLNNILY
jgi:hypothetical protein